jgi:acetylornithine deacetylase/succinyl-diaminopimelate desuccinylase-like protein
VAGLVSTDVVGLCQALVRIPSVTGDDAEVEVSRFLTDLLGRVRRATVAIHEGRPGRPNVVATLDGVVSGPTLLLTGHVDVVPAGPEGWTHPPFAAEIADERLWGRGACDMKGGVAALIAAFASIARDETPFAGRLVLALTADEEGEGRWGIPWLLESGALTPDLAVVAEPAGVERDFDRICLAVRGHAVARLVIETPTGHTSLYHGDGSHAQAVAARLLLAIEDRFRPVPPTHWAYPGGPTVVAGEVVAAGGRWAHVPERAELSVSCRLLPGGDGAGLLEDLRRFVTAAEPEAQIRVEPVPELGDPVNGAELDPEHPLARAAVHAFRAVGHGDAELGGFPGYSEGEALQRAGIPTLPALGPGLLRHAHQPDEHVMVDALRRAVEIYRRLATDVLAVDPQAR